MSAAAPNVLATDIELLSLYHHGVLCRSQEKAKAEKEKAAAAAAAAPVLTPEQVAVKQIKEGDALVAAVRNFCSGAARSIVLIAIMTLTGKGLRGASDLQGCVGGFRWQTA